MIWKRETGSGWRSRLATATVFVGAPFKRVVDHYGRESAEGGLVYQFDNERGSDGQSTWVGSNLFPDYYSTNTGARRGSSLSAGTGLLTVGTPFGSYPTFDGQPPRDGLATTFVRPGTTSGLDPADYDVASDDLPRMASGILRAGSGSRRGLADCSTSPARTREAASWD